MWSSKKFPACGKLRLLVVTLPNMKCTKKFAPLNPAKPLIIVSNKILRPHSNFYRPPQSKIGCAPPGGYTK